MNEAQVLEDIANGFIHDGKVMVEQDHVPDEIKHWLGFITKAIVALEFQHELDYRGSIESSFTCLRPGPEGAGPYRYRVSIQSVGKEKE